MVIVRCLVAATCQAAFVGWSVLRTGALRCSPTRVRESRVATVSIESRDASTRRVALLLLVPGPPGMLMDGWRFPCPF